MAKIEVVVCDVCHRMGQETSVFELHDQAADRKVRLELCADDAAPIQRMLDFGQDARRGPRRRTFDSIVTTPEEIARMKRARA